jgi:hypothetical protein
VTGSLIGLSWPDRRVSLGVVGLLACSLLVGCGYPKIGPRAYELTKGLDAAVEQRNREQLQRAMELIEASAADGSLLESERDMLLEIVDIAAGGSWQKARERTLGIMKAQASSQL